MCLNCSESIETKISKSTFPKSSNTAYLTPNLRIKGNSSPNNQTEKRKEKESKINAWSPWEKLITKECKNEAIKKNNDDKSTNLESKIWWVSVQDSWKERETLKSIGILSWIWWYRIMVEGGPLKCEWCWRSSNWRIEASFERLHSIQCNDEELLWKTLMETIQCWHLHEI